MGRKYLKNIGLWKIKGNGFTLIEVMAYLFISNIILAGMITLLFTFIKVNKEIKEEARVINRIEGAFININALLKDKKNININVGDEEIFIEYKDIASNLKGKRIAIENYNLVCENYEKVNSTWKKFNYNLILGGLEKIKVWKNGVIIYVEIQDEDKNYLKGF